MTEPGLLRRLSQRFSIRHGAHRLLPGPTRLAARVRARARVTATVATEPGADLDATPPSPAELPQPDEPPAPPPAPAGWVVVPAEAAERVPGPDGFPVPPEPLRGGYGASADDYVEGGRAHARTMLNAAERHGLAPGPGSRVLDFGCGAGRMIRALAPHAEECEIWGVDIDEQAIAWCREHLSPPFHFGTTPDAPHLPFEDRSFDLIYAGSVFTQVVEQADAWLLELRRLLRPGGILHVSINDDRVVNAILDSPPGHWLHDTPLRQQLLAFDAEHQVRAAGFRRFVVDLGGRRPEVFHDLATVRGEWGRYFEVREVEPEAHAYQTGLTLMRPMPVEPPPQPPPPLPLDAFAEAARDYVRCDVDTRAALQSRGLNVEVSHFYSCIPTVDEIQASFEYAGDERPYVDDALFPPERLADVLRQLDAFAGEFTAPEEADPSAPDQYYWNNGMFTHSDAMAYYCMIRLLKPRRIVEIGCGHSTLVALRALERNGSGSIVCVEPYPPSFFDRIAHRVERLYRRPAQAMSLDFFNRELSDGDFLFIDTTHTVKAGSDCLWLYLRILPHLKPRVTIHAHDIFLPRAYPKSWLLDLRYFWTEQYLLHALLIGNPKFEVCYGSAYHRELNRPALQAFMRGQYEDGGSSLWFRSLG